LKSKGSLPQSVDNDDIAKFLQQNTIYCDNFKARITKAQCEINQTMATVSVQKRVGKEDKSVKETVSGCKFCENFSKTIANRDTSISKHGFRMIKRSKFPKSENIEKG
jgi:hypothetical protein